MQKDIEQKNSNTTLVKVKLGEVKKQKKQWGFKYNSC